MTTAHERYAAEVAERAKQPDTRWIVLDDARVVAKQRQIAGLELERQAHLE